MSWSNFNKNKTLIERGNDTTRTVTMYDESGAVTSTRPYTSDENATADAAIQAAVLDANRKALLDGLKAVIDAAVARQADVQTVLDTTNSTINGSPAGYLKTIARATKRQDRAIIRLAKLAGNLVSSADTGTD